jgi:hypothetical protein
LGWLRPHDVGLYSAVRSISTGCSLSLLSILHGVIRFTSVQRSYGVVRRHLEIVKIRSSSFAEAQYDQVEQNRLQAARDSVVIGQEELLGSNTPNCLQRFTSEYLPSCTHDNASSCRCVVIGFVLLDKPNGYPGSQFQGGGALIELTNSPHDSPPVSSRLQGPRLAAYR